MKRDKLIFDLIEDERERQTNGIELIASENYVSDQVLEAMGSILTNKYAEGYPGARYYGGCEVVDQVEQVAIDRAKASSGRSMPTCSRTPAARPMQRCMPLSFSRGTRSSGSTFRTEATSRTVRR